MTPNQLQDLLKIKQSLGIPDPRHGLKECELCDNAEWRPGVSCATGLNGDGNGNGHATPAPARLDPEAESIVQAITNQILQNLKR